MAKKVGKAIDKTLNAIRTFLVVEGMEIDHIHIKLYPVYKVNKSVSQKEIDKEEMEKWYNGYITTLHGPRANDEELSQIAKKIRGFFEG